MAKKVHEDNKEKINYIIFVLVFVAGVIPLIMRFKQYNSNTSQFVWDSINDLKSDIYIYYKSLIFVIICSIMLFIIVYKQWVSKEKCIKFKKLFIPLLIYDIFVVLSTIFSKYKYFSIHGMSGHYESIFVLIGYTLVIYYCFLFIQTEKDIKTLINGLSVFVLIMGLIGVFQFIGKDFWTSGLGKTLMIPDKYLKSGSEIFNSMPNFKVSLSLYNPNYIGLYVGLMIPFFGVQLIFKCINLLKKINNSLDIKRVSTQNIEKIFFLNSWIIKEIIIIMLHTFITVSMFIALIGSNSSNGYLALIISIIFGLIIFIAYVVKKNIKLAIILLVGIVLILGVNINKIKSIIISELSITDKNITLQDIQTNQDNVSILYKDNRLNISYEYNESNGAFIIHFEDEHGNVIDNLYDSNSQVLNDERFKELKFIPTLYNNEVVSLGIEIDGVLWHFTNQLEDGSYYYFNMVGRPDKIVKPEVAIFKGLETLGSGRGFIWGRTIPLLKDNILIGSGPDTFVIEYPQQDYVGIYNYMGNQLIDKPHNLYLQTAIQTGLISLLALVSFFISYIIWSIKIYIQSGFKDYKVQVGLASLLAVIGFLVSCMLNDSTIAVTPVFCVILGLGIAINYQLTKLRV